MSETRRPRRRIDPRSDRCRNPAPVRHGRRRPRADDHPRRHRRGCPQGVPGGARRARPGGRDPAGGDRGHRDHEDPTERAAAYGDAILTRIDPTHTPSDRARQYAGMTLRDMAGDCLRHAGIRVRPSPPIP